MLDQSFAELVKELDRKEQEQQERAEASRNFVPRLYLPYGETKLLFISDIVADADHKVVWAKTYQADYVKKLKGHPNSSPFGTRFVYNPADPIHPEYIKELEAIEAGEKDAWGKKRGEYPHRVYAYVINLTGYNAFFADKQRYTQSELAYQRDEKIAERKEYFKGPMLLELNGDLLRGLVEFQRQQESFGVDHISLHDYVFRATKKKENRVKYDLSPVEEIEVTEELRQFRQDIVDNNTLPPLDNTVDKMRFRGDNLGDEYSFKDMPKDDDPEETVVEEDSPAVEEEKLEQKYGDVEVDEKEEDFNW